MTNRVTLVDLEEDAVSQVHAIYTVRPNEPILITESERDEGVYRRVFDDCRVYPVKKFMDEGGREKVKRLILKLREGKWSEKIRGIIDKDLDIDELKIEEHHSSGLLSTDYADMEMYAFLDIRFAIYLEEYLSAGCEFSYPEVITQILRIASPLGAVRVIGHNLDGAVRIDYKSFDYKRKGNRPYITNINLSDDIQIITETIAGVSRHQSGRNLAAQVPDLFNRVIETIQVKNRNELVKSSIYESCMARYIVGNRLNGNTAANIINTPDLFLKEARNFLKSNPEAILDSQLGKDVLLLSD